MATLEDAWKVQERWATYDANSLCLLDLRRRVEALEQRVAPASEVISAHGCADVVLPAPAADRPLWEAMSQARYNSDGPRMASVQLATAAEIDAVAEWLAAREHCGAASALRIEARRAREGQ